MTQSSPEPRGFHNAIDREEASAKTVDLGGIPEPLFHRV